MTEACARISLRLPEYVERGMARAEEGRIAIHLSDCTECRREAARHLRLLDHLDRLPLTAPPARFRPSIMERIRAHPLPVRGRRRSIRLGPVRAILGTALIVAAASAAAGALGILLRAGWNQPGAPDPTLIAEWGEELGRLAFAYLLEVATRTSIPALFALDPSAFIAGPLATLIGFITAIAAAMGLGFLATARVLLRSRSR